MRMQTERKQEAKWPAVEENGHKGSDSSCIPCKNQKKKKKKKNEKYLPSIFSPLSSLKGPNSQVLINWSGLKDEKFKIF